MIFHKHESSRGPSAASEPLNVSFALLPSTLFFVDVTNSRFGICRLIFIYIWSSKRLVEGKRFLSLRNILSSFSPRRRCDLSTSVIEIDRTPKKMATELVIKDLGYFKSAPKANCRATVFVSSNH